MNKKYILKIHWTAGDNRLNAASDGAGKFWTSLTWHLPVLEKDLYIGMLWKQHMFPRLDTLQLQEACFIPLSMGQSSFEVCFACYNKRYKNELALRTVFIRRNWQRRSQYFSSFHKVWPLVSVRDAKKWKSLLKRKTHLKADITL